MADVGVAFSIVFLAEIGDKTQLVALTTAGRHGAVKTLAAFAAAIALLQTVSVAAGSAVGSIFGGRAATAVVGGLFVVLGLWTWWSADGDKEEMPKGLGRASLLGATGLFLLAELGDKTMIATAALAAERSAVFVWLGSFAAMVAATGLAVVVGQQLVERLSGPRLARIGAVVFVAVGVITIVNAIVGG
ncbi:MAG: TMEM165/GDT1 family protein [Acidimicrobiales bacterium]|nr:TMEM165/GDT1 family protein [Acidimicrobiales bacterium]MYB82041.1 TMEM165/GDT1 family protein [Acidimicrobiales bacterium]MYI12527.1 TMEM165/GDT1 family protein [Acidimicrobiales bacterium]